MPKFNPGALTVIELLQRYGQILEELKRREIIRTQNNPVADYAEWLVSTKLKLNLAHNAKAGYDATDKRGERIQIKSRRLKPSDKAKELAVIRKLKEDKFDYLIAVLFDMEFTVKEAYKIPRRIIEKYAHFSEHVNGHILRMTGKILVDPKVENITKKLL